MSTALETMGEIIRRLQADPNLSADVTIAVRQGDHELGVSVPMLARQMNVDQLPANAAIDLELRGDHVITSIVLQGRAVFKPTAKELFEDNLRRDPLSEDEAVELHGYLKKIRREADESA